MKPGLTCIWQTSPNRNDLSFSDWMKLDLEYIDNWSLLLDFKLLETFAQHMFLSLRGGNSRRSNLISHHDQRDCHGA